MLSTQLFSICNSILFIIFIAGNGRVHIAIGCNRTVRTIRTTRIAYQEYMKTKHKKNTTTIKINQMERISSDAKRTRYINT